MGKAGQAQMPIQEAATAECTLKNKEEWGKQEAERERESPSPMWKSFVIKARRLSSQRHNFVCKVRKMVSI